MDFDSVVWAPVYPGSEALRACFGPVTIDVFPADMLADGRWRWSMAATEDGVADAEFVIMHSAESLPDRAAAQRAGVAALLAWRDSIRPGAVRAGVRGRPHRRRRMALFDRHQH